MTQSSAGHSLLKLIAPGRKEEMFHITMHSTHFIYSNMASEIIRGNSLFSLPINKQGIFFLYAPNHRIALTTSVVTPVVEH